MSEANPQGAAQALAGRTFKFRSRELCLTEGVLLGCDIVGVHATQVSDLRVLGTIVYLASLPINELACLLMRGKEAIEKESKVHLAKLFPDNNALKEAVAVVGEMVSDYANSFCRYDFPSYGKNAHTDLRISGVGNRATVATTAIGKMRMSWLEYLACPATRMNVFYAALCEGNGGVGLDTFYGREQLKQAEQVFAHEREKEEKGKPEE